VPFDPQKIQAVTFDAAGTLIAPHPSVGEAYADVLGELGVTADPEQLESRFRDAFRGLKQANPQAVLDRRRWREIVARTLENLAPEERLDTIFEALWEEFAQARRWRVLDHAPEALAALKARGLRLFVLSNNDERLPGILDGLGLGPCFEAIFFSAELSAEKPSLLAFRAAEARIGVSNRALLHVGDSPAEDLGGALNAGWQAALIGSRPPGQPHNGDWVTLENLAGLIEILAPDRKNG